jgi:hypothetical protein
MMQENAELELLLNRLSNLRNMRPETRLCCSIIKQAIRDYSHPKYHDDAKFYFASESFDFHCNLLKLSANTFREQYLKWEI